MLGGRLDARVLEDPVEHVDAFPSNPAEVITIEVENLTHTIALAPIPSACSTILSMACSLDSASILV